MKILMGFWGTAGGGAGASASPISGKRETLKFPTFFGFWSAKQAWSHGTGLRCLSRTKSSLRRRWLSVQRGVVGADWRGKLRLSAPAETLCHCPVCCLPTFTLASFQRIHSRKYFKLNRSQLICGTPSWQLYVCCLAQLLQIWIALDLLLVVIPVL